RETKGQPATARSLSSCRDSRRPNAAIVASMGIGHNNSAMIQTAPGRDCTWNGSQPRQTPVGPKKCNQEFVTRKGGNAKVTSAVPRVNLRAGRGKPNAQIAVAKPKLSASTVVRLATSKLF